MRIDARENLRSFESCQQQAAQKVVTDQFQLKDFITIQDQTASLVPFVLPLLYASGCYQEKDRFFPTECPGRPVKIVSDLQWLYNDISPFVFEDLALMEEIQPDWLCGLEMIEIRSHDEGDKAYGVYGGTPAPCNKDKITLYVRDEFSDLFKKAPETLSDSMEIERQIFRYIFFHEWGHFIANRFASEEEFSEFAEFSYKKLDDEDCPRNQSEDHENDIIDACWVRTSDDVADFVGGTITETPLGMQSASEDWAHTFAFTAMTLLNQENPDVGIFFEDYYSPMAQAKVEWMKQFILSHQE